MSIGIVGIIVLAIGAVVIIYIGYSKIKHMCC
uniref:Uncharacterized protein n=1 Tax=viral metagenome TaxID=1070528 RepID=A0A6C0KEF6_9ZZZZ